MEVVGGRSLKLRRGQLFEECSVSGVQPFRGCKGVTPIRMERRCSATVAGHNGLTQEKNNMTLIAKHRLQCFLLLWFIGSFGGGMFPVLPK